MRRQPPRPTGPSRRHPAGRVLAALLASLALVAASLGTAAPAQAGTYTGFVQGQCAQAVGTAFRLPVRIPVTEVSIPVLDAAGQPAGTIDGVTAYMTMNLEWCSDGTQVTYARLTSAAAAPTGAGNASLLERRSYTSNGIPPTSVGGPYTLTTSATWGRTWSGTISGQPFGVGGSVTISPANFQSTMTVRIYPSNGTVECTGSTAGRPEPCFVNL